MLAPVPDARAGELRSRLLIILSNLANAAAASSTDGPGLPPKLDPKLIDAYNQWRKEYEEWLKIASKMYAN
jgi:hypothetical protein